VGELEVGFDFGLLDHWFLLIAATKGKGEKKGERRKRSFADNDAAVIAGAPHSRPRIDKSHGKREGKEGRKGKGRVKGTSMSGHKKKKEKQEERRITCLVNAQGKKKKKKEVATRTRNRALPTARALRASECNRWAISRAKLRGGKKKESTSNAKSDIKGLHG